MRHDAPGNSAEFYQYSLLSGRETDIKIPKFLLIKPLTQEKKRDILSMKPGKGLNRGFLFWVETFSILPLGGIT